MKKVTLIIGLLLSGFSAKSQTEFNHSGGITLSMVNDHDGNEQLPGFTYNPRFDYILKDEISIGVSAYPTIGGIGSSSYSSRDGGDGGMSTFITLPIVAQINFGHHSSTESRSNFGGFFGAGFNLARYSDYGNMSGINVQGGIKFLIKDQSYGIRVEYTKVLGSNSGINVLGLGLMMNIQR